MPNLFVIQMWTLRPREVVWLTLCQTMRAGLESTAWPRPDPSSLSAHPLLSLSDFIDREASAFWALVPLSAIRYYWKSGLFCSLFHVLENAGEIEDTRFPNIIETLSFLGEKNNRTATYSLVCGPELTHLGSKPSFSPVCVTQQVTSYKPLCCLL